MLDMLKTVLSRIGDFWSVVIDLIGIACCYGVGASVITGMEIATIWQNSLGWLGVPVDFAGDVNAYISSHVPVFCILGIVLILGLILPVLNSVTDPDLFSLRISNLLTSTYIAVVWIGIALFDVSCGIGGVVFAFLLSVVLISRVCWLDDGSLPRPELVRSERSKRIRRLLLSILVAVLLVFMWPVGCLLALLWRLFGL